MKVISVSNPFYSRPNNSAIDAMVTFDDGNTYPYTAIANDSEIYGIKLWADLNDGKYGAIAPYVAPPPAPQPVPDLATQLTAALIAANVIPASAIDQTTLSAINVSLVAAGQPEISTVQTVTAKPITA